MKKVFPFLFLLIYATNSTFSQQEDIIKKQYDFIQSSKDCLEGYMNEIGGTKKAFPSLRGDIKDGLIAKCTNGNMPIEWQTQKVPDDFKSDGVWFACLSVINNNSAGSKFDVFINNNKLFTIVPKSEEWKYENTDGSKIQFFSFKSLYPSSNGVIYGYLHGYISFYLPKKLITPGKPVKIKIVGEAANSRSWIIVYKATDACAYLKKKAEFESWADVEITSSNGVHLFEIKVPSQLSNKTLTYRLGKEEKNILLKQKENYAYAEFSFSGELTSFVLKEENEELMNVHSFANEGESQIILLNTFLINKLKVEGNKIIINSNRIYKPKTISNLIRLSDSMLGKGSIYLMNSSHQDIAWMDSPEKCIIERDTMLITPMIALMQKNSDYRFDIEDALMIREYIDRHPDKENTIRQLLNDGKLSCGAAFNQPYEEMYSGEALAREFYLGAKWLKDKFNYSANTYFNEDVPGRTLQMPQILKKAGISYLMISRFEKSIFNWESPDSSKVLTYSSGHYGEVFIPLNEDFYTAADYIASGSLIWNKYYSSNSGQAVIPLFSDEDMSSAKNYSPLINKWNSIDKIEKDATTEADINLPKIKMSTASEFMKAFGANATNIPTIYGERPALWLYIHGPSHEQALTACREGDILLTAAEKFSVMDALTKGTFTDYPQQRLTNAWEAKIYPDHGWGGNQGQITDDLFKEKLEFSKNEGLRIVENATYSIASHINTNPNNGIPVIVFNSLNWERNDVVRFTLNFEKGKAYNILLKDYNNNIISHQKEKISLYDDGSMSSLDICFIAEKVPSLGYKTYYVSPVMVKAEKNNIHFENSYENQFYIIEFSNGGISKIFDKQLNVNILQTDKFKAAEVFTMQSVGNGAGEFDNVQQPTMENFDKTGNYHAEWKNISNGEIYSSFQMRQQIRNAVVDLKIIVYNNIKKIDFELALLNWDGVLYREYRMALPLNMKDGMIAYEVPYGVLEVGKDEIKRPAGERYKTPSVDIHPRGIQNWIGASNNDFGVTLSSSVAVADYVDITGRTKKTTMLQPILLASRRSCHPKGNEYLQTGNHYYFFSLTSHKPGWNNGFHFGLQANEKLFVVVNPEKYAKSPLPEEKSFFSVDADNVIISCIKKAEDDNSVILRFYDISGKDNAIQLKTTGNFTKAFQTNLIEAEQKELLQNSNIIPFNLGHHSIETIKLKF